jgi:hypothetical protein
LEAKNGSMTQTARARRQDLPCRRAQRQPASYKALIAASARGARSLDF